MTIESKTKALQIARFIASKKANDITILDVRNSSGLCDYFVICSGESTTQVNALYEAIVKEFKKTQVTIHHWEKSDPSHWVLVDFFDVILHIFDQEARHYYNLEYVWNQARKVRFVEKQKTRKHPLAS